MRHLAVAALLPLTLTGCFLESAALGEALDAGPADAGSVQRVDAALDGGTDAGIRPRDAGPRDSGPPDSGPPDSGPPDAGPPSCQDVFGAVDGFEEVCLETAAQCGMRFDRSGGLSTNTRSCTQTCEALGWTCHGSAGAGTATMCVPIIAGTCGTQYNHQVCVCDRP